MVAWIIAGRSARSCWRCPWHGGSQSGCSILDGTLRFKPSISPMVDLRYTSRASREQTDALDAVGLSVARAATQADRRIIPGEYALHGGMKRA